MAIALLLFQLFLAKFVLRDRDLPDLTISVDNRYLCVNDSLPKAFLYVFPQFFPQLLKLLRDLTVDSLGRQGTVINESSRQCAVKEKLSWYYMKPV